MAVKRNIKQHDDKILRCSNDICTLSVASSFLTGLKDPSTRWKWYQVLEIQLYFEELLFHIYGPSQLRRVNFDFIKHFKVFTKTHFTHGNKRKQKIKIWNLFVIHLATKYDTDNFSTNMGIQIIYSRMIKRNFQM